MNILTCIFPNKYAEIVKNYLITYISVFSKGSCKHMILLLSISQMSLVCITQLTFGREIGKGRSKLQSVCHIVHGGRRISKACMRFW